jgi:tetratricopeptide (TPR) repeat protein
MLKLVFVSILLLSTSLAQAQTIEAKVTDLIDNDKSAKAIKLATKGLKSGESAQLYYLRGFCYSQLQKYDLAIADFDASLKIAPNAPQTHYDLGYTYFLMSNSEKAIAGFDKAIQLDKNFAEAYLNRGSIKLQSGDLDGACEDWQMAANLGMALVESIIEENCGME